MKINYSNAIEEYYLSEVMPGTVFFFASGVYETEDGNYKEATGAYMLGRTPYQDQVVINLDDGAILTNVNEDSKVYFPKKAELNIERSK